MSNVNRCKETYSERNTIFMWDGASIIIRIKGLITIRLIARPKFSRPRKTDRIIAKITIKHINIKL